MGMTALSLFIYLLILPLIIVIIIRHYCFLNFLLLLLSGSVAILGNLLSLLRLINLALLDFLLCLSQLFFGRLLMLVGVLFGSMGGLLLRLLHLPLHLLHLHLLLLLWSGISSWGLIIIIMAHLPLIIWLILLAHSLLLWFLIIVIFVVFFLLVLNRYWLPRRPSLSLWPSELIDVLLLLYHFIVVHVMIIWDRNLSKHRWRIFLLRLFCVRIRLSGGRAIASLFDCDGTIATMSSLVLLINLNILRITDRSLLLRLMIKILKIIYKLTDITKVHGIFLLSLPSFFFLFGLLINQLLYLFLFKSSVFFFSSFFGLFLLILLPLLLILDSFLFVGLTLDFSLLFGLFFFFDSLLLSIDLLLPFFLNLLVHHLLGEHLGFLLGDLGCLLLSKEFGLLLCLLCQYLLSFALFGVLQLFG